MFSQISFNILGAFSAMIILKQFVMLFLCTGKTNKRRFLEVLREGLVFPQKIALRYSQDNWGVIHALKKKRGD
jgi:hypothetical protein